MVSQPRSATVSKLEAARGQIEFAGLIRATAALIAADSEEWTGDNAFCWRLYEPRHTTTM